MQENFFHRKLSISHTKKGVAFTMSSVEKGEKKNKFTIQAIIQISCKSFVNKMDDMHTKYFPRPE